MSQPNREEAALGHQPLGGGQQLRAPVDFCLLRRVWS